MFLFKKPKFIFLLLFIISNIYSCLYFINTGHLLGEVSDFNFKSEETSIYINLLIIFFYLFFLVVIFRFFSKIHVNSLLDNDCRIKWCKAEFFWGKLLIIIQILFIFYFCLTNTFGANSLNRDGGIISALWVVLSPDNLFFIYYSIFRKSRYAKYNLLLAILSNILRGWSGILIFIVFIELCYRYREGKLKIRLLSKICGIMFLLYPVILAVKYGIRDSFLTNSNFWESFDRSWLYVFNNNGVLGYINGLLFGIEQFFSRIQLFSNAVVVYSLKHELANFVITNKVTSYWQEGIYGIIWNRIFDLPTSYNLGEVLANFIDPQSIIGSWNSNPTFLSWLFIDPFQIGIYLLFTIALCFITMFLVKKITSSTLSLDMLWYMWLILIMPGWFASLILFLNTLIIFYVITFIKLNVTIER